MTATIADVLSGAAPYALVHGDCLDPVTGLASLPERCVQHCITDPPYSEHTHEKQWIGAAPLSHVPEVPRGQRLTPPQAQRDARGTRHAREVQRDAHGRLLRAHRAKARTERKQCVSCSEPALLTGPRCQRHRDAHVKAQREYRARQRAERQAA